MSWEYQFGKSLNHHLNSPQVTARLACKGSLESSLGENIFSMAAAELGRYYLARTTRHLSKLISICQSPIEEAMLYALCIQCHKNADTVRYVTGNRVYGDAERGCSIFTIQPQTHISGYRVDFLVTYENLVPITILSNSSIFENTIRRQMIIECDGYDYHFRTKQQAIRDRKRDRKLQRLGFKVFRYTGSEIWQDVFNCAEEAISSLGD